MQEKSYFSIIQADLMSLEIIKATNQTAQEIVSLQYNV